MLALRRILLPTDFSAAAADAERRAHALARLFRAELHVLHITQGKELSELPRRLEDDDPPVARRRAEHVSSWLGLAGDTPGGDKPDSAVHAVPDAPDVVRSTRQAGSVADGIQAYADEVEADLVVVGTSGEGRTRGPLLGSTADRVIRTAAQPVVTVRPDVDTPDPTHRSTDPGPTRRLVVPIDFSEPTRSLVAHAKHWAEAFEAQVDFLHVIEEPRLPAFYGLDRFRAEVPRLATAAQDRLQTTVDETEGPDVDAATRVLVGGDVAERIVEYAGAQEARMILMATHGLSGLRRYVLGGVTDQVLRSAPCPVCAIKSYGRSLVPGAQVEEGS